MKTKIKNWYNEYKEEIKYAYILIITSMCILNTAVMFIVIDINSKYLGVIIDYENKIDELEKDNTYQRSLIEGLYEMSELGGCTYGETTRVEE